MQIDFYTTVIDNYWDWGFSFNLAISLLYYHSNLKIRYFFDDKNLFLKLKWNLDFKNLEYYDLKEIKTLKPSKTIFNFFDRKIDFEYLHTFDFQINFVNFSYFLLHSWVQSLHNTQYNSKNVSVTHFIPSLLESWWGIIINPYLKDFENEIKNWNLLELREKFLSNLDKNFYNKKWISTFCYMQTFENIKEFIWNDKENIYFVFDNSLSWKNIVNMPFLSMLDYYKFLYLCDKNIVRWENSLVLGMLTGKPFLWDIYKEHNLAHTEKMDDFSNYLKNLFWYEVLDYIEIFKDFNKTDSCASALEKFIHLKQEKIFEKIKINIWIKNDLIENIEKFLI